MSEPYLRQVHVICEAHLQRVVEIKREGDQQTGGLAFLFPWAGDRKDTTN